MWAGLRRGAWDVVWMRMAAEAVCAWLGVLSQKRVRTGCSVKGGECGRVLYHIGIALERLTACGS